MGSFKGGTSPPSSSTQTYTYDKAGNLASEAVGFLTYAWNAENQLVKAESAADPVFYKYDGDNLRVERTIGASVTKGLWDHQNLLLETDGTGAIQAVYTLDPQVFGNLISQRRGSTSHWHMGDDLGSVTRLVNVSGAVSNSYRYSAYGERLSTSGSVVNPFQWIGRLGYYVADGGFSYVRRRWYDPVSGRWVNQDPIGFEGRWNLYEYVNSTPTAWVDPSGLLACRTCYWRQNDDVSNGRKVYVLSIEICIEADTTHCSYSLDPKCPCTGYVTPTLTVNLKSTPYGQPTNFAQVATTRLRFCGQVKSLSLNKTNTAATATIKCSTIACQDVQMSSYGWLVWGPAVPREPLSQDHLPDALLFAAGVQMGKTCGEVKREYVSSPGITSRRLAGSHEISCGPIRH